MASGNSGYRLRISPRLRLDAPSCKCPCCLAGIEREPTINDGPERSRTRRADDFLCCLGAGRRHFWPGSEDELRTDCDAMTAAPEIHYALTSTGLHLAYQVEGAGSLDLVQASDGTVFSFDATPEQPRWQAWVDRLASFSRLVRFDRRGVGLSDPIGSAAPPTVEQWASDTLTVMDACGIHHAAILACSMGGL